MGFRCFCRKPPLKPSWIHLKNIKIPRKGSPSCALNNANSCSSILVVACCLARGGLKDHPITWPFFTQISGRNFLWRETLRRGPSRNCLSPSSVLCPSLELEMAKTLKKKNQCSRSRAVSWLVWTPLCNTFGLPISLHFFPVLLPMVP